MWADLGAGSGTFTRALAALLGTDGVVHAIDRDAGALREIDAWTRRRPPDSAAVITARGDFTGTLALPALDGALLANALHFVPYAQQQAVLERVVRHVRPGGRLLLVEYDRRGPNRWVPYPVSLARFAELAAGVGLDTPVVVGARASAFGGEIYAAAAQVR